jgi:hypothetical protein
MNPRTLPQYCPLRASPSWRARIRRVSSQSKRRPGAPLFGTSGLSPAFWAVTALPWRSSNSRRTRRLRSKFLGSYSDSWASSAGSHRGLRLRNDTTRSCDASFSFLKRMTYRRRNVESIGWTVTFASDAEKRRRGPTTVQPTPKDPPRQLHPLHRNPARPCRQRRNRDPLVDARSSLRTRKSATASGRVGTLTLTMGAAAARHLASCQCGRGST